MRKKIRTAVLLLLCAWGSGGAVTAQELFVYTEPASNMPAGAAGLRLTSMLMRESNGRYNYHAFPEAMWGISKNLMLHAEGIFSNRSRAFRPEGLSLYAKYRFLSHDAVQRHFRMAAFARASVNNADIHQEEIETNGHNSGCELGLTGTQLLHKTALSLTASYEQATDNAGNNELPAAQARQALNGAFSIGRLVLPRAYTGYRQTNLNLMAEVLTQYQPAAGRWFADVAPSVQLIFNSQTRVDIGYRCQLSGNMTRTAPNGFLLRIEHLIFGFRKSSG